MFQTHLIDAIPYEPDVPAMLKRLRVKPGSSNEAEFTHMLEQARPLARPRALLISADVTGRGDDWVEIEGFRFVSRVLRVNMETAYRAFPYLATCGSELQDWAETFEDVLLRYWAEGIKESALACASQALSARLDVLYQPGHTVSMNPGSLEDWPIQEQRTLFTLFGSSSSQLGVSLTDSLLMVPTKSVSGIRFPTEASFESCQLCPREACPGRRAPYDTALYAHRFAMDGAETPA